MKKNKIPSLGDKSVKMPSGIMKRHMGGTARRPGRGIHKGLYQGGSRVREGTKAESTRLGN